MLSVLSGDARPLHAGPCTPATVPDDTDRRETVTPGMLGAV
jgi:hypothetical protein